MNNWWNELNELDNSDKILLIMLCIAGAMIMIGTGGKLLIELIK